MLILLKEVDVVAKNNQAILSLNTPLYERVEVTFYFSLIALLVFLRRLKEICRSIFLLLLP